jgi:hypothetical protein
MPQRLARLAAANRLHREGNPFNGSASPCTSTTSSPSQCLRPSWRSIFRLRQGLLTFAMDDVLADGGVLCSRVCLLVGVTASSHCSCQREKESADHIGIHAASRGGNRTSDLVMSRSRRAAVVVPMALVSAASKASGSSFSASARALSSANCAS